MLFLMIPRKDNNKVNEEKAKEVYAYLNSVVMRLYSDCEKSSKEAGQVFMQPSSG